MVFFPTLRDIKGVVKIRPATKIDNFVFRLHYKYTFGILVLSALLLAKDSYFGQKIDCHLQSSVTPGFLNHFCWLTGPYLVESALTKVVGKEVTAPGIANPTESDKIISYYYYQWIVFILGLQSAAFYTTHLVWKIREGGLISHLVSPLISLKVDSENKKPQLLKRAAEKLCKRMGTFKSYFRFYFALECVNLFHVLLEIYLTNIFLNGLFITYGVDVICYFSLSAQQRQQTVNPMTKAFPLLAKCTFHRSGPEGGIETLRPLCQLPLNIMNERIFLVLWFVFWILAIINTILIVYRIVIVCSQRYRYRCLFTDNCKAYIDKDKRRIVIEKCSFSDWWIVHLIFKNLRDDDFVDFIDILAKTLKNKRGKEKVFNYEKEKAEVEHQLHVVKNNENDEGDLPINSSKCLNDDEETSEFV
ncbi:innexin inx2-like protein [Leptotrombidium deliense]|uniref:Innexin n=1 Tax=Leptotrombidium deliense TaxID=299467 RepID=A0A443SWB2_9ACAR|nr:innexin inx2-like protein [Leptotrombidium deliense]